jgi:anti-sigma B factor antagonist
MSETSTAVELELRVTTRRFGEDGVCLETQGELDLAAAPLFSDAISAAIFEGHRHVVIDLEAATFLDCACLGAILAGMRPLRAERDAALVLAGANGSVERLLALLEFERTCPVVSSVDEAATLVLGPNDGRDGWRTDEPSAPPLATDTNPPIQGRGDDELSP